jgi:hypothetical protein
MYYWILAAIFLLLMLAVPKMRPVAAVGCVILGGLLLWAVIERVRGPDPGAVPERGRPTTPVTATRTFPLEELQLSNLKLEGGGAPFRLTGRATNRSTELGLKSLMLDISRRDCHEDALDPSGCAVIWRGRHWVEVSVPPQQARDFATSIWARGDAARVVGTTRDDFQIVAASAEPAPQESHSLER